MVSTVIETGNGKVEGVYENGLLVFKGVPYAAPPLGVLRWAPPQPHTGWKGIRPATEYGKIAIQPSMPGPAIPTFGVPEESAEDCLFLNIWTPAIDNQKRPVMVWIHGGAFCMGSGSQTSFRSGRLARNGNIVLVTINYRLGILGFLNLMSASEGQIPATGNEGLLDQIAALKWVRENIGAFGGDPANITVFGESAGGMSIGCLMAMPAAQGLFQKAILESGVGVSARPLEIPIVTGREFLKKAGWTGSNVEAMRSLTPHQLLRMQAELPAATASGLTPVLPVIDGQMLPNILEALKTGASPGVKILAGSNLDEWRVFTGVNPIPTDMSDELLIERIHRMFPVKPMQGDQALRLVAAYRRGLQRRGGMVKPADIMSAIQGDSMFKIPAIRFMETRRNRQEDTYCYLFTWPSPMNNGAWGACHTLEVGFVFGEPDPVFCGNGPDEEKLSYEIQMAWTAFARTGDPTTPQLGNWPQYDEKRQTMILGKISHVEEAPFEEERAIWDEIGVI